MPELAMAAISALIAVSSILVAVGLVAIVMGGGRDDD